MTGPAYAAARAVARQVERHFIRDHAKERERGGSNLAPAPDAAAIEALVEAAFWASLRREENYPPRVSLAFLPPPPTGKALFLERAIPLTPEALTRLAPAVERPGIHLGVWRDGADFLVWGATRVLPALCFTLEVVAPGLLVIKHRREEGSGKFVNVAVLEGDRIKILNHKPAARPDYPALVSSLLGFDAPGATSWSVGALIQLAVSMREHGRGGTLLLVPRDSESWRESIVNPVLYSVSPPFTGLGDLMRHGAGAEDSIRRAVDAVAGLTAVDGAMVLSGECEVLAFGTKIGRRTRWPRVESILEIEPVEGSEPRMVHPAETGGARHLSAAQFAHDQRDALAMVASQDGRFTVMAWSMIDEIVQAYRVEALLM